MGTGAGVGSRFVFRFRGGFVSSQCRTAVGVGVRPMPLVFARRCLVCVGGGSVGRRCWSMFGVCCGRSRCALVVVFLRVRWILVSFAWDRRIASLGPDLKLGNVLSTHPVFK